MLFKKNKRFSLLGDHLVITPSVLFSSLLDLNKIHGVFLEHLLYSGGSDSKESACNAGDLGSIPGLGRSPGGGNGNPLQYSCLENPIDREAWQATVHGVTQSQT